MAKTSNLGLELPSYTDKVNITTLNTNWSLVDSAVGIIMDKLDALDARLKALEEQKKSE